MKNKVYDKEKVSKCCNAPVWIGGDDREGTHYYMCNKCGNPCDGIKKMENKDWRERLRDLYLVENDDITSPNSIDFDWGSFLFRRRTSNPMHFYLITQGSLEDFISSEIEKAEERGYKEGYKRAYEASFETDVVNG